MINKTDILTETKFDKSEMEMILTIDEDLLVWEAYVSSPKWMKILDESSWENTKTDLYEDGSICAKIYNKTLTKNQENLAKAFELL